MTALLNLDTFKVESAKLDIVELKQLLSYFATERILQKLVLLGACVQNGQAKPVTETLAKLGNVVEGERIIIGLIGRAEAAKVYGAMADMTSDIEAVDYILKTDVVAQCKKVLLRQKKPTSTKSSQKDC